MKKINTQRELRNFLQTSEAFEGEFNYKGFGIWWNVYDVKGVQTPESGYFRCDPCTDTQYREFEKLMIKGFEDYDWLLS